MASSSRVHTLHENAKPDTHQPNQENHRSAFTGAGLSLDDFTLPPAKTPPPEAQKPSKNKEWQRDHPNPSEEDLNLRKKELEAYQIWFDYTKERDEVEANGAKLVNPKDTIFDDNDFLNKDEAIRDWVDEMALVIRTQADEEKRDAAYKYLLRHLKDDRHSDIREACKHNRDRLGEWARGGYKGAQPKTEFFSINVEGETIITNKPSDQPDDWSEVRRRTDAPPAEDPPEYPSENYMSKIVDLWERGTPLLQGILETPEKIRLNPGEELRKINVEIDNVKNEYVRGLSHSDRSKAQGIPQLGIPTGWVVELLVESTERAIQNGTLTNDEEASSALKVIKEYVSRANQGEMWIENMKTAFDHHIKKAQQLYNNGADSIEKIHASDEFWNADLAQWIRTKYMASAQSTDAGPEWRSQEEHSQPDSDRMSISSEQHANARDPEMPELNNAGGPTASTTAAGQNTGNTAQSQPLENFDYESRSSLPTADEYTLMYHGAKRIVGGYRYRGIVKGGGHGFSVLLLMKGDNFYHMIASSEVDANDSEPLNYLENGGYLIGDVKDVKRRLNIGNSIEGRDYHFDGQKFKDFKMSAYAVTPRSQTSDSDQRVNQYIRGHFDGGAHAGESRWYSKSGFCELGGFRQGPVQEMIDIFKSNHSITPQDEIKLESKVKGCRLTHWSKQRARPMDDRSGSDYLDASFVVPDSKRGASPTDMNQQMENFKTTMMEHVDKRIKDEIQDSENRMGARLSNMENMMRAMMVKLNITSSEN